MKKSNPIESYPPSKNRLLVIDWASLSYHQFFSLVSKARREQNKMDQFKMDTPEKELFAWNTKMLFKLIRYVRLFNPKDIVLTLEGMNVWRNEICKDYYLENTDVHYDNTGYYVRFDNFLIFASKKDGGEIQYEKLNFPIDMDRVPSKSKKLKDMPERIIDLLWNSILPKYKGKRKDSYWPFLVKKSAWKKYKEKFAKDVSKLFRAHVIGMDEAEGDDVIYVTVNYWKKKYDSIVLVTGDSDMLQLLTQENLRILDHKSEEMVECESPEDVLEIKILAGDSSDNINGMALPGKKNQLGPGNARKLYESEGNTFQKAKDDGWENQYLRNQKLIDLTHIPTHIQRNICELLESSEPKLGTAVEQKTISATDKVFSEISQMKNLGFYAVNALKTVEKNPAMFNSEMFNHEKAEPVATSTISRKFEGIGKVFDDPLEDEGDLF